MQQSVSLLDEIQNTTTSQMNFSYDKVSTMDNTVGAINNKVADVEDNLNYLLGRLSLIVSEFSILKASVTQELESLRLMSSVDAIEEYKAKA